MVTYNHKGIHIKQVFSYGRMSYLLQIGDDTREFNSLRAATDFVDKVMANKVYREYDMNEEILSSVRFMPRKKTLKVTHRKTSNPAPGYGFADEFDYI